MAENRALENIKYVCETFFRQNTRRDIFTKVSRQGEKERRCSDLQGAKTSRTRRKLGARFYYKHAESVLTRFSHF